jgi:hypothetical protein
MVFSWEHDIKVTKNHQNLLPTQSVLVAHTVIGYNSTITLGIIRCPSVIILLRKPEKVKPSLILEKKEIFVVPVTKLDSWKKS